MSDEAERFDMHLEILGYKKTHGVKRFESPPIHIVHKETLNTLCGKDLNWRWELIRLDLKAVLALSEDVYCLNCYKALLTTPEKTLAA